MTPYVLELTNERRWSSV